MQSFRFPPTEFLLIRAGIAGLLLVVSSVHGALARPAGVPVLIYHEIVTDNRPAGETVIHIEQFLEQMKWLHDHHYTTLSISELAEILLGNAVAPDNPVVLTFDDGWRSGLLAVPVLEQYKFKATFLIIAGPKGIGDPYLTWDEILKLDQHPLFKVESHTFSHPWDRSDNLVTWVDGRTKGKGPDAAYFELSESKRLLEEHLNRPIRVLAWPCGWYNDTLVALAKEAGYTALLSAVGGLNVRGAGLDHINRTFIDGACPLTTFEETLQDGRYRVCQVTSSPTLGHLP